MKFTGFHPDPPPPLSPLARPELPGSAARPSAPAPARWRLRLLGGFALDDGSATLVQRLPSRAITLLLVRLALEPERDHGREELIDLLWPDVALDIGRNRLRQGLSALRSVLEPSGVLASSVLLADRRTVRLVPGAVSCDVDAFRHALGRGDRVVAAQLYRGDLLPGFFDEWVLQERQRLAALAEGLARVSPAPPAPPPAPAAEVAPAVTAQPRCRLPSYLTCMLGFEAAGAALAAAVKGHRLVVLRGPGGAGKTRLAVEVARSLAEDAGWQQEAGTGFDLVAFVPLAACETREALREAVLLALRQEGAGASAAVSSEDDLPAPLAQFLAGRRVLLLLDNFEQLVEVGRGDVARWLARLPSLHLLVTSRRALGLDGEVEQALPPLSLPAPDASLREHALNPAVALFVDRARASRADFHLGERNHGLVAAIVRELQGLPLAIELAAARVRSLSLADMLAMLQGAARQAPGRSLSLLSRSGPRAADDARHASMQRVVAWSWDHLQAPAQAMLAALSAFDGGATLQAAAAVQQVAPAMAAALLDELVAASVVHVSEGPDGGCRYHPFEPVREFVLMRVGDAETARLRAAHCRWVASWAAALGPSPSLAAFRDELPNLLAALAEAAGQGDAEVALRIVLDAAHALDDVNLPPSALPLLRRALDGADGALAAQVHAILAGQSLEAGEREMAAAHAERALALAASAGPERAPVLRSAARVLLRTRGVAADIAPLLDEALSLARRHGLLDVEARTLSLQAVLVAQRDLDWARSLELKRQALALWQEHGPPARVTEGLVNLALGLGGGPAMDEKLDLLQRAREAALAHGQTRLLAFVFSVQGYALADLRRWDEAAASYLACLRTAWDGGIWREWFYGLWNLPRTLAHGRRPEPATRLMGFADAFYATRFGVLGWSDLRERRRTRRLARVQLSRRREEALWREGSAMSMAEAMRLAALEAAGLAAPPVTR